MYLNNNGSNGQNGSIIENPDNGKALIVLRDVAKTYSTAAGEFIALKDVDLEIRAGEFVAITGKSGSGKTTLINVLTGIDRPTGGEIFVCDTPVHELSEAQIAGWRGLNVGVVFQFFQLLPTLTILENVMLPMGLCNLYSRQERFERGMHLLSLVDLTEQAGEMPPKLSGGEQQRAAIARALANDPPIIATDEPTGNLDSVAAESVIRLFEELVCQGKTILMVTHDEDLAQRASRKIVIADGLLISDLDKERPDYSC